LLIFEAEILKKSVPFWHFFSFFMTKFGQKSGKGRTGLLRSTASGLLKSMNKFT